VRLCLQDSEIQEKKEKLWFLIRKQQSISDFRMWFIRLRKAIKSRFRSAAWFPLFAINPQKFMDNPNFASKEDYTKAFIKVYGDSSIEADILK
jgi:hypothetical protein